MYILDAPNKETFREEDEQDILYRIKLYKEEGINVSDIALQNAFDENDIYEEDVEDFCNLYDLENELSLDLIIDKTMFYNFETNIMGAWDTEYNVEDYIYQNYHKDWQFIKDLLDNNEGYKLATAIHGENGYLYFSPGYHFVNREGYMIYKSEEELTEDYLI